MNSLFITLHLLGVDLKKRLSREDRGATAVEYGLLVGLIAVVIIAAVVLLGGRLTALFTQITNSL
jgi:pilus assembly protein Flp/PilA